jgi:hypothetical protein
MVPLLGIQIMLSLLSLSFLLQPATLELIQKLALLVQGKPPTQAQDILSKLLMQGYTPEQRISLIHIVLLQGRAFKKLYNCSVMQGQSAQDVPSVLLCDKLALEQATGAGIAQWKAHWLFAANHWHVGDFCCGMGGESLRLPLSVQITAVDLDEKRLLMYAHNLQHRGNVRTVQANVCDLPVFDPPLDVFIIDPARRSEHGAKSWSVHALAPSIDEIALLCSKYPRGVIKLPPGLSPEDLPLLPATAYLYLGTSSECSELLVLTGDWSHLSWLPKRHKASTLPSIPDAEPEKRGLMEAVSPWIGAVNVPNGEPIVLTPAQMAHSLPVKPIGAYILEPFPACIRSGVFPYLAAKHGMWSIDPQIAYVSADVLPQGFGEAGAPAHSHCAFPFKAYKVLCTSAANRKQVKKMLQQHHIHIVTVKKRGFDMDTNAESAALSQKPKGTAAKHGNRGTTGNTATDAANPGNTANNALTSGVVIYLRQAKNRIAVLCQPVM